MRNKNRMMLTAAAVCALLATSTAVYASRASVLENASGQNSKEQIVTVTPVVTKAPSISLQSFADSDQSKAETEWVNFYNSYDQDKSILNKIGNGPTGLDPKYDQNGAYSQEMADKLDEITSKYNLTLHNTCTEVSSEELIQNVASGNFLGTANTYNGGYMYEDGTFHFDGCATLDSGLKIDYQFMNNKKGTLNNSMVYCINKGIYDKEWSYTASCGTDVCLAIGKERAMIIADLGDSFMSVSVLAGTDSGFLDEEGKITAADLEALANTFDFTLIK